VFQRVAGMPRIIIAVTGMPGSGKSLVAREIADWLGFNVYKMGDVVRREVVRRGLPLTVENVERVATELREMYGRGAVARLLLDTILEDPGPGVVVDGMRSMEEARILEEAGRVVIVAVHASRRTRLSRLLAARRREDDVSSEEDLRLRDRKNLEFGIGEVIALADYMIVNEGSVEEAREQARRVAERIANEPG